MKAINPATNETLRDYPDTPWKEAERRLNLAAQTFQSWRRTPMAERAKAMHRAAEILRKKSPEYGELMAREMGKPISGGRGEATKCAWVCDYYADNAAEFLAPQPIATDATKSFAAFEPLGAVLAIMPWNFPFWQVFRCAAPALMAGNTVVLKHASNVPGCALAIESVFKEAGFPDGAFTTLLVPSSKADALIEHPSIAAVSLTGSVPAGRAVAAKAGSVLKKTVLELGGSDPYVVLADADIPAAVDTCVTSRLINSGQSCIAAKRFIVVDAIRAEFEERFVARMRQAKMDDPMADDTEVGPQARVDLRDELHQQVTASVAKGAKLLLGGTIPDRPGAWYPPTVLTNVQPGMPAYDDELFGPVAAIIAAHDEADAIRIANDTSFGLGAAVFTRDVAKGEAIAQHELAAGACFVNAFVKSDPRLPFGGIKASGYGRELSAFGIHEFVNIKAVYVA